MAGVASRDRPVASEVRGRLAMTTETEVVEARFCADPDGGAAAAMATDTGVGTGPISEVVMTLNTVHGAMLVMWKCEQQRLFSTQERFTQGQRGARTHHHKQREKRAQYDCQDEARMPSEDESPEEGRGLLSRGSPYPRT